MRSTNAGCSSGISGSRTRTPSEVGSQSSSLPSNVIVASGPTTTSRSTVDVGGTPSTIALTASADSVNRTARPAHVPVARFHGRVP